MRVGHKAYRLRLAEEADGSFSVEVGGRRLRVRISGEPGSGEFRLEVDGREYPVRIKLSGQVAEVLVAGKPFKVEVRAARPASFDKAPSGPSAPGPARRLAQQRQVMAAPRKGAIISPIPGRVVALKVRPGDKVRKGDVLLIIEAMKMENEIRAPRDGTVKELLVSEGSSVSTGQPLLVLD